MVILWWKKLRNNNVENAEGIRDWKCSGEGLLLVMDALLIGKSGQGIIPESEGVMAEISRGK